MNLHLTSKQKQVVRQASFAFNMYQKLGESPDYVFYSITNQDLMTTWYNRLEQRLAWLKKNLDKKSYNNLEF